MNVITGCQFPLSPWTFFVPGGGEGRFSARCSGSGRLQGGTWESKVSQLSASMRPHMALGVLATVRKSLYLPEVTLIRLIDKGANLLSPGHFFCSRGGCFIASLVILPGEPPASPARLSAFGVYSGGALSSRWALFCIRSGSKSGGGAHL